MDMLDLCDDLVTPVTDKFVLSAVKCSKNNKNSVIFVFDHPEDYDKTNKSYESVIWTYTKGAVLPACQCFNSSGHILKAFIHFKSAV